MKYMQSILKNIILVLPVQMLSCGSSELPKTDSKAEQKPIEVTKPTEESKDQDEAKQADFCEEQRQLALKQGLVAEDLYKIALRRNFIPVFSEREGKTVITEWIRCSDAKH